MKNKPAVVLLSGGLDSAAVLYLAKAKGYQCHCLIFDYGQRHRKEINCAANIAQASGSTYRILKIYFPWKGSALLDKSKKVREYENPPLPPFNKGGEGGFGETIPSTYVPARNIIFLSFALSFAETIKAKAIFIGAHAQDYSGYPDCRPEFFKAFAKMAAAGTYGGGRIKILAPLLNKKKAQIIGLGQRLGAPFNLSWSCYRGAKLPCGVCDSCHYRAKGFQEAGLVDPLNKR